MSPSVPENEMHVTFSAAGGPGGQNVNKVASKVTLRWHVGSSLAFTEEQKGLIRSYGAGHLNKDDEIVIQSDEQRSQHQNRESATLRLQNLVAAALAPRKVRKKTRPSRAAKQKRLDEKHSVSRKKRARRGGAEDY